MIKRVLAIGCGGFLVLVLLAIVSVVLVLRSHQLHKLSAQERKPEAVAGNYSVELPFDGLRRHYIVHVPPTIQASTPTPLVIALHGGGGSASTTDDLMKLTPIADREGFIVVFPDGVGHNWNDGRQDAHTDASDKNIDDVGFIRAVIDDLATHLPIDRRRVYATGISNGAMMSGRLACDASDVIAAVALVAGTATPDLIMICHPPRPVPVLSFNGTKDPLVHYSGGTVPALLPWRNHGRTTPVEAVKFFWTRNNLCQSPPTVTLLPDTDHGDGSTVTEEAYTNCTAGADVVFYRIDGGGHTWPGGRQYLPERLIGHTNRDINASEIIWRFFAAHPLP